MPKRDFQPDEGMDIGVGFNAISDEVCGDCVELTELQSTPNAGGQNVFFSLDFVTSREQFFETMNISLRAALKSVTSVSGSAKAKFGMQQSIHRYSVFLAVIVVVRNATVRMRDVTLKDNAADLMARNHERFRTRCGDEFLVGYTTGGEFYGLLEIEASSKGEQNSISADIQASGAGGTWNASVTFERAIRKITESYQLNVRTFQRGGMENSGVSTVEQMINRAVNFPNSVSGEFAVPYSATFMSYDTLDLPDGANPIDLYTQQNSLDEIARHYLQYSDLLSDINYVLAHPQQFENIDADKLNNDANAFRSQLNNLRRSASLCYNDYQQCQLPTELITPTVILPDRRSDTELGSIHAARAAAEKAQNEAAFSIEVFEKVSQVAEEIKPGRQAMEFQRDALVRIQEARESLGRAENAAAQAEVVAGINQDAKVWVKVAKEARDIAAKAMQNSDDRYRDIERVALSPYWNAPKNIISVWDSYLRHFGAPVPLHGAYLLLSDYAVDPSGGELVIEPVCLSPMKHNRPNHSSNGFDLVCKFEEDLPQLYYAPETAQGKEWDYGTKPGIIFPYAPASANLGERKTLRLNPHTKTIDGAKELHLANTFLTARFYIKSLKTLYRTKVEVRFFLGKEDVLRTHGSYIREIPSADGGRTNTYEIIKV